TPEPQHTDPVPLAPPAVARVGGAQPCLLPPGGGQPAADAHDVALGAAPLGVGHSPPIHDQDTPLSCARRQGLGHVSAEVLRLRRRAADSYRKAVPPPPAENLRRSV